MTTANDIMIPVPTFREKSPPKQLDITNLSSSDFSYLESRDPFMYYSIPGCRISTVHDRISSQRSKRNSDGIENNHIVTRRSCVSVEGHSDLLVHGLIDDINDTYPSDIDLIDFDILSILSAAENQEKQI
ncbi:hypothetical protein HJC23_007894 [Cyclotella cryptica]|uniref:Uncharacterized protein n=1 Tax=Cyclotella cryptica TaxID=29204 RepID=A0ABD3R0F8_9STRA|eukprot:CCRYP_000258-RA/>CCRYP_000258-RA protein AED:0.11 eAED:0.11 QI:232/1/1/1/0/0/2/150/129